MFLEHAAEFAADWIGHLFRHQVEAGTEAMTGPQGARHEFHRVRQLGGEFLQPAVSLKIKYKSGKMAHVPAMAGMAQGCQPATIGTMPPISAAPPEMAKNLLVVRSTSA